MAVEKFDLVYRMSAEDEVTKPVLSTAEVLQRLGISSEEAATAVDKAMGKIGIRFGAFAQASDTAIASVTNQYNALGKGIDETTKQIVQSLQETGRVDLGTAQIAKQEEAVRLNLVALKAQLATQEQLAASQTQVSAATTQYIERLRTKIAAEEADAAALRQAAVDAKSYEAALQQQIGTMGLTVVANERVTAASGATRAGMQNLGFQLQDIAVQFASGQRAGTILAQQLPQVSMAVTQIAQATGATSGLLGRFAAFMSGPWGVAIGVGTAVLAPFIAKLFETGNAADNAAAKVATFQDIIAKLRSTPAQALGEQQKKVFEAEAALRKAQGAVANARGGSAEYLANTYQGRQRSAAVRDAELALQAARSELAVLQSTAKTNEQLFTIVNSAGRLSAKNLKDDSSGAGSKSRKAGRAAGKAYTEGAAEELRRLQAITDDILASFKPGGDRTSEQFARRDANAAQLVRDGLQASLNARTQPLIDDANKRAGPLRDYAEDLKRVVGGTDELNLSLQRVQVDGLQSLEDGLAGVITGTQSVASAFKNMANAIIADLVRIAVKKLILSVFGFSDGGLISAQKKASGGLISGPGSGTSDDVPIWASNGEFMMRAEAVRRIGVPTLEALNAGRMPGFARGGVIGGAVSAPRIPSLRGLGGSRGQVIHQHVWQVNARGAVLAEGLIAEMQAVGVRAAVGGAELSRVQTGERQMSTLY